MHDDRDPSTSAFLNALLRELPGWHTRTDPRAPGLVIEVPVHGGHLEIPVWGELGVGRWPLGVPEHVANDGKRRRLRAHELAALVVSEPSIRAALGAGDVEPAARQRFVERVADSERNMNATLEARRGDLDAIFTEPLAFERAEQALLLGHSIHPAPRAHDSPVTDDLARYVPQHATRVALEWLAVRRDRLHVRTALRAGPALPLPEPEVEPPRGAGSDVVLVPLHPLQVRALDHELRAAERRGELWRLGPGLPRWAPTSSMRTLYRAGASVMLKLSLPVRLTNSMRTLSVAELERGLTVSRLLDETEAGELEREFPGFSILREPAYYGLLDGDGACLPASFVALRENPFGADQHAEVLATLLQDDPRDGCSRLAKRLVLTARASGGSGAGRAEVWFSSFLAKVCRPIFVAQGDYGLLLSAHQQNLVLGLRGVDIERVWFRDTQGTAYSPLARERFADRVPRLSDACFEPPLHARLFAYSFVVNSVLNVIASLSMVSGVRQATLVEQLRAELEALRARPLRDPSCVDYLLHAPEIWAKGNLRCCLRGFDEVSLADPTVIYHPQPNPLRTEPALERVTTGTVSHPRRPPTPPGLLYRRYCPGIDRVFSLRSFDLEQHFDAFVAWMNDPVVAEFWEQAWPRPQLREYVEARLADPHAAPLIGYFDDVPFAYFEAYWAKEDRLGAYYEADDYDRGFHMAVGDPQFRFRGHGRHWFLSMAHFLFLDEPRTQRLVGEPRIDQARVRSWADTTAWKIEKEIQFPHKRAVLMTLRREDFFADFEGER